VKPGSRTDATVKGFGCRPLGGRRDAGTERTVMTLKIIARGAAGFSCSGEVPSPTKPIAPEPMPHPAPEIVASAPPELDGRGRALRLHRMATLNPYRDQDIAKPPHDDHGRNADS
jgi:hypothetical protein